MNWKLVYEIIVEKAQNQTIFENKNFLCAHYSFKSSIDYTLKNVLQKIFHAINVLLFLLVSIILLIEYKVRDKSSQSLSRDPSVLKTTSRHICYHQFIKFISVALIVSEISAKLNVRVGIVFGGHELRTHVSQCYHRLSFLQTHIFSRIAFQEHKDGLPKAH